MYLGLPLDPDLRRKAIRTANRDLDRKTQGPKAPTSNANSDTKMGDSKDAKDSSGGIVIGVEVRGDTILAKPGRYNKFVRKSLGVTDSQLEAPYAPQAFRRELKQGRAFAYQQAQQDRAQRELKDIYDVANADPRMSKTCPGDEYYDMAAKLLDTFRQKRSPDQKMFHNAFLQTCVPHLYAEDFLGARIDIMKRTKRKAFNMAALILTPRRWGKTTATSMGTAVLMYCCRGITIVIFSTGLEMSTILMNKVKGYFMELPRAQQRILKESADGFYITRADETSTASKKAIMASGRYNKLIPRAATVQGLFVGLYLFCICCCC